MMIRELSSEQVRWTCDPALFSCDSTLDLMPAAGIIGQGRALSALEFGLNIANSGFNIYVSGLPGTGKTTAIKAFLEALAAKRTPPPDWCYVYNFHDAYSPRALRLPTGTGTILKKDMEYTIENASRGIAQAFASKEYANKREEITHALNKKREGSYQFLDVKTKEAGFLLQPTPAGLVFVLAEYEGMPVTQEQYERLSAADREQIARRQEELSKLLREEMTKLKSEESATQKKLDDTDREVVQYAISYLFDEMERKYHQLPQVIDYLNEVKKDITDNLGLFEAEPRSAGTEPFAAFQAQSKRQALRKYGVNVLVDNSSLKGAPVILESNATFNNLFGRTEKEAQFGALYTDFTMIKSGSLHRANGGYLVAHILDILANYQSWEGLKRTLREHKLLIEEVSERLGYISAVKTLTPEPIPLDIKVVLVGDPLLYYLLYQQDPEFKELFKIKADFDSRMDKSEANLKSYAGVICRLCHEERLRPLKSGALAKVIEYSTRLSSDQEKLSTLFADVADIVREANFWAGGVDFIEAKHVTEAIEKKIYRSNLIQERINEMIGDKVIMIDTEGESVGQLNGLSVIGLGDFSFGRPSRITASVGVGREGLIDIERESRLGGPIHTKGVMILIGYLMGEYAQSVPLSLSARLVFEQSYEGVEGDSASSAELYTILSRLAEVPIRQNIAVTGSVNQKGEVQAIGGVNEKIEGFFEVCRIKGLTGKQGVCIPESNARNLMLKEEVVEAVRAGKFHIYTVSTIDEGIEVLTGMKAGERLSDGSFEPDTFNDRVQKRLAHLSEALRQYSRDGELAAPAVSRKEAEEPEKK